MSCVPHEHIGLPEMHDKHILSAPMNIRRRSWKSFLLVASGLLAAVAGKIALESSSDTWPVILIVIGLYAVAAGIFGVEPRQMS